MHGQGTLLMQTICSRGRGAAWTALRACAMQKWVLFVLAKSLAQPNSLA
jgi:hypothetical protein